ncbi:phage integrase family protein [Salsuginibacillus halophilus]|uniref:Phage integrase family protein n=1 Tax=Salsuginibacillus halophilus TaxID=517424 RepID=A0A2P8H500_9BACI|nr:site-specific integrase [Salsuginibacillus halophilus]PSL41283.1 phage integrase family protein [Salsuginibacillus halophilus]
MQTVEPIREPNKIEAMKRLLRSTSLRNELLFVMGINTGMRIGDLLSLTMADVTSGRSPAQRIERKEQKTGKQRSVVLNKSAHCSLKKYMKEERPDWRGHEPLFMSRKGGPITRQHAHYILKEAAGYAGIEHIGTHSMRKTFGYFAYHAGHDITVIQALLNHSSQQETLRYIGVTQDNLDAVVQGLEL